MAESSEHLRVLQVTRQLPFPASSGGRMRTKGLASAIATFAEVDILGTGTKPSGDLGPYSTVFAVPHTKWRRYFGAAQSALAGRSIRQGLWMNPSMSSRLRQLLVTEHYDVIFMEELGSFVYLTHGDQTLPPIVHSSQNAEHRLAEQMLGSVGRLKPLARLEVRRLRDAEFRAIVRSAATVVVSDIDRSCFELLAPSESAKPLVVVPNCVMTPEAVPEPVGGSGEVLFVASFAWRPNIAAAKWLADEVVPRLRDLGFTNQVRCLGSKLGVELRAHLTAAGVLADSDVDSVWPYLARARVAVVPLHVGGGSRIKIVEAWSAGLPVVSTTTGAEGLGANSGEDIVIADDPAAFASAIASLIGDDDEYRRLRAAGLARASGLSWDAAIAPLQHLVQTIKRPMETRR